MSKPKPKSKPAKAAKGAPTKASKSSKPAPKAAAKPAPKPSAKPAPRPAEKPAGKAAPKPPAATGAKTDVSKSMMQSAQDIWLAGLGAFGKAQLEGGKLFSTLVKEGSDLQQKTRKIAGGAAGDLRSAMTGAASEVRERTQETWERLEQVFENRVTTALAKLGLPGRKEIEELQRRIDEVSKEVRKSTIGLGVKTGFGQVMTTGVRRARDDLSDLARELEEAQLAAKQAAKKNAPAKKK
ncbi:MAG: phasin family protein [Rudaea sp.]